MFTSNIKVTTNGLKIKGKNMNLLFKLQSNNIK